MYLLWVLWTTPDPVGPSGSGFANRCLEIFLTPYCAVLLWWGRPPGVHNSIGYPVCLSWARSFCQEITVLPLPLVDCIISLAGASEMSKGFSRLDCVKFYVDLGDVVLRVQWELKYLMSGGGWCRRRGSSSDQRAPLICGSSPVWTVKLWHCYVGGINIHSHRWYTVSLRSGACTI